jgi:hypothetical protein
VLPIYTGFQTRPWTGMASSPTTSSRSAPSLPDRPLRDSSLPHHGWPEFAPTKTEPGPGQFLTSKYLAALHKNRRFTRPYEAYGRATGAPLTPFTSFRALGWDRMTSTAMTPEAGRDSARGERLADVVNNRSCVQQPPTVSVVMTAWIDRSHLRHASCDSQSRRWREPSLRGSGNRADVGVRCAGRRSTPCSRRGPRFVGANKIRQSGMKRPGVRKVDSRRLLAAQICAARLSCAELIGLLRS